MICDDGMGEWDGVDGEKRRSLSFFAGFCGLGGEGMRGIKQMRGEKSEKNGKKRGD